MPGQMTDQIAYIFAIGELSRPGQGKDVYPSLAVDEPQGLIGTKVCIACHDDLFDPGRRLEGGKHGPKQFILMPLDVRIDQGASNPVAGNDSNWR
jgi:hypothetical protein